MLRVCLSPAVMPQPIRPSTEWLSLMAYVDQNQSGQKTVSAVISAIVLGAVGYAFVNGLAYDAYKKVATKLNVIDIKAAAAAVPCRDCYNYGRAHRSVRPHHR